MEQPQIHRSSEIIGQGASSTVALTFDQTRGHCIFKWVDGPKSKIEQEVEVLERLKGYEGFPQMHEWGYNAQGAWILMGQLGTSLKSMLREAGPLGNEVVVQLGLQMLERVERVHESGFVHGDLKLEHFLLGLSESSDTLHLIDFGISQKKTNTSANSQTNIFRGTLAYSSVSLMKGQPLSIHDDLQSLLYLIVELLEGTLPWLHLPRSSSLKMKYQQILRIKTRGQGFKKYGAWVRETLRGIRGSADPHYSLRLMICKLLDY